MVESPVPPLQPRRLGRLRRVIPCRFLRAQTDQQLHMMPQMVLLLWATRLAHPVAHSWVSVFRSTTTWYGYAVSCVQRAHPTPLSHPIRYPEVSKGLVEVSTEARSLSGAFCHAKT
jgi:hypothetical protein